MAKRINPLNNNGAILLRFSVKRERYALTPVIGGKFGNAQDMKRAETVAALISADIAMGSFDATLIRYGGALKAAQGAIDQAQERLKELRQQRGQADLKEIWGKYRDFKAPQLAPTTLKIDYGRRIDGIWDKLDSTRISEAVAIRDWLVFNKSPEQAKKILQNLNAACEWAVKSELIEINPFKGMSRDLRAHHDEEEINPFTPGERDQIIAAFEADRYFSHYAPLVNFIFATGCRPSEAVAVQWGDLRNDKLTFHQTFSDGELSHRLKTQKKRTIALNKEAIAAINTSKTDPNGEPASGFIFASLKGNRIDWHNFANRAWRHILAGLPEIEYRNPKQMKHSLITERILAGDSPVDVGRYVGTSPGTIYKHYLGASREYSPG